MCEKQNQQEGKPVDLRDLPVATAEEVESATKEDLAANTTIYVLSVRQTSPYSSHCVYSRALNNSDSDPCNTPVIDREGCLNYVEEIGWCDAQKLNVGSMKYRATVTLCPHNANDC